MSEPRYIDSFTNNLAHSHATGRWWIAAPLPDPLIDRIRHAWAVLRGTAVAVRFHQDTDDMQRTNSGKGGR